MDSASSPPSSSSSPLKRPTGQVLDGSEIMELVANNQVFSSFVDHKFHELDTDKDGKLSLKELHPAVADIGAALGLPPQGTSLDSDNIYSEVSFPSSSFLLFIHFFLFFIRFPWLFTAELLGLEFPNAISG